MLSRLVITFLPRSKCLFNFTAAITICSDFGAQKNKVSQKNKIDVSPSVSHEVMGPDAIRNCKMWSYCLILLYAVLMTKRKNKDVDVG